jgi:branched-chain amino acid transport system substrate-binding protein
MAPRPLPPRPRWRLAIASAAILLLVAGCTGSSLGNQASDSDDEIRIGLLIPKTGAYKSIGDDQLAGWRAALDMLGGTLDGRKIKVIEADEGDGKAQAQASGKKLLEQDKVVAIVGGATADTVNTLHPMLKQARVPLIGIGGRPSSVDDPALLWHASWLSQETGAAIAQHMRITVPGPVYVIGPDYIGGHDQIGGFVTKFTADGGKLANPDGKPAWTPWAPKPITDFEPYLTKIKASGAKAVYAFYAGSSAVEFVKQYRQFVPADIPLYGSGFLTEGAALDALGATAKGVYTSLNYSTTLDNAANRQFVGWYQSRNGGKLPNLYSVVAWDAALVLDKAIREAFAHPTAGSPPSSSGAPGAAATPATAAEVAAPGGTVSAGLSSTALTAALGRIGEIDSPRGGWQFGPVNHTPVQKYYLRQVLFDGKAWVNITLQELATLGS